MSSGLLRSRVLSQLSSYLSPAFGHSLSLLGSTSCYNHKILVDSIVTVSFLPWGGPAPCSHSDRIFPPCGSPSVTRSSSTLRARRLYWPGWELAHFFSNILHCDNLVTWMPLVQATESNTAQLCVQDKEDLVSGELLTPPTLLLHLPHFASGYLTLASLPVHWLFLRLLC
jgi:hypothetical protein